jgi:hypothetical protein
MAMHRTPVPSAATSAATPSSSFTDRAVITTLQPARASARATALPIPLPLPVTTAALPVSSMAGDHGTGGGGLQGRRSARQGPVDMQALPGIPRSPMPPSMIDLMKARFSCRTYTGEPLPAAAREELARAAGRMLTGPFGSALRFVLEAAEPGDDSALKRLGTYGTIRGASAFLIGTARRGDLYLEDFGYAMEELILKATALDAGTVWIGGFFTRGTFARRIDAARGERIPAVAAVGMIGDRAAAEAGLIRRAAGGSRRKPWETLFFDRELGRPLSPEEAGPYRVPLEMVRIAPSASNRQPWRVVKVGDAFHFYLQRTPNYPPGKFLLRLEDLQRVDMGIAMCHFELAAEELGLAGSWRIRTPGLALPDQRTEYSVTWEPAAG